MNQDDVVQYDLHVRRGRDFREYFGFRNDDGSPVDLTGKTVKLQCRKEKKLTAELIFEATFDIPDPASGDSWAELTDEVTALIAHNRGYYDLLMIDDVTGDDDTWAEGSVFIHGSVTANA